LVLLLELIRNPLLLARRLRHHPHMSRLLFALLALGACAEAGKSGIQGRPDGQLITIDSSGQIVDAFVAADAPPGMMTKTLSQTTSNTNLAGTAPACGSAAGNTANSYIRVFDLATFGITTTFTVTQVTFQIDESDTGQTASVSVGTYVGSTGDTLSGTPTMVGNAQAATIPPTTTGATITAPITGGIIPGGSKLLVEVDSPAGGFTYIGANKSGESAPGYLYANDCGFNPPKNISKVSASFPTVDLLMTVTGTY
jgi:hypothetical protein